MVSHCHTSCSVLLVSLHITCACAEKLSVAKVINQICSRVSGTCCRQGTLELLLLGLLTLAGLCVQVCAHRCTIHALNECCRTSPSNFTCSALEQKVVCCPFCYRVRQEQVYMYMIYLVLNLSRHFKFLPLSFQFPAPFQFAFFFFEEKKWHF